MSRVLLVAMGAIAAHTVLELISIGPVGVVILVVSSLAALLFFILRVDYKDDYGNREHWE